MIEWFQENNIDLENHGALLYNFNPMNGIYTELEGRVYSRHWGLLDTTERHNAVESQFADVLPLVWDSISGGFDKKWWKLIPKIAKVVIKTQGSVFCSMGEDLISPNTVCICGNLRPGAYCEDFCLITVDYLASITALLLSCPQRDDLSSTLSNIRIYSYIVISLCLLFYHAEFGNIHGCTMRN